MRSILILGLVFTLAAVPAAQAQQIAAPPTADRSVPSIVEVPLPRFQVDPAPAPEIRSWQEAVPADAQRDFSARNALAIVGGLVIVIALIAFLR